MLKAIIIFQREKRNTMNPIKISLVMCSLLMFSACQDFLELAPEHQTNTNNFYQTPADFEVALMAVYNQAQLYINNTGLLETLSDNSEVSFGSANAFEYEFEFVDLSAENPSLQGMWDNSFFGISYSNAILGRIGEVSFSDEKFRDQLIGEARFMRAWNYFNLVRMFGELPIILDELNSPEEEYDKNRRPVAEVYDLIIEDLRAALERLPETHGNTKGRATSGAAAALLGKVFLTLGRYEESASLFAEIIQSGRYELEADYGALFSPNNANLPESIFEIEFTSGEIGEGHNLAAMATPADFGLAMFPGGVTGGGRSTPTQELVDAYEAGDLRRDLSVLDSVPFVDPPFIDVNSFVKYVDFTLENLNDGGSNYLELRFADVLLMYAEALNGAAYGDPAAFDALNRVRLRAGLPVLSAVDLPDQESFFSALERERRFEFAFERKRWFDLVRTGRIQEVMEAHFINKGDPTSQVEDHELIFPVPQREIDLMGAAQNPGF